MYSLDMLFSLASCPKTNVRKTAELTIGILVGRENPKTKVSAAGMLA
jgi:hypothetical protein